VTLKLIMESSETIRLIESIEVNEEPEPNNFQQRQTSSEKSVENWIFKTPFKINTLPINNFFQSLIKSISLSENLLLPKFFYLLIVFERSLWTFIPVLEFCLLLIFASIFCWTFGLLWLFFAEISQIILPVFMFTFGFLLLAISAFEFFSQKRKSKTQKEEFGKIRRKVFHNFKTKINFSKYIVLKSK